jgi:hypothetical protein
MTARPAEPRTVGDVLGDAAGTPARAGPNTGLPDRRSAGYNTTIDPIRCPTAPSGWTHLDKRSRCATSKQARHRPRARRRHVFRDLDHSFDGNIGLWVGFSLATTSGKARTSSQVTAASAMSAS